VLSARNLSQAELQESARCVMLRFLTNASTGLDGQGEIRPDPGRRAPRIGGDGVRRGLHGAGSPSIVGDIPDIRRALMVPFLLALALKASVGGSSSA
jgi:hypothetical protein